MKTYLLLAFIAFAQLCNAQSYEIDYFQGTYDTLVNYKSATLEAAFEEGGDPDYWEKGFDFGFDFPFYGELHSQLTFESDGVGYFPEAEEFNFYFFGIGFTIGEVTDTTHLHSEVRYNNVTEGGLQALVIEYHNMYMDDEYQEKGANHFMNFQLWWFENGIIELRFGSFDLDDCSYYFPGQGFSFDNVDPEGEIYGPWMFISNSDETQNACFFGDHNDPVIMYDDFDNCGVLTSVPESGFVVQFVPDDIINTEDYTEIEMNNFKVAQSGKTVTILGDLACFESCTIYNSMGQKIAYSEDSQIEMTNNFPEMIVMEIKGECGVETHKIMMK